MFIRRVMKVSGKPGGKPTTKGKLAQLFKRAFAPGAYVVTLRSSAAGRVRKSATKKGAKKK